MRMPSNLLNESRKHFIKVQLTLPWRQMSLPSSPSRFSLSSNTKPIDVGKPLGIYDTNSVRDRIRQWQAQGGGVVTAEDFGAEEEPQLENPTPKSKTPKQDSIPRTLSRSEKAKRDTSTPIRSGRSVNKGGEETRDCNRSGSAPAKRVMSDQHWRKKRSPPKITTSSRATNDNTRSSALPDDGIRVKPITESKTDERRSHKPSPESKTNDRRKLDDERTSTKRDSVGSDNERRASRQESVGGDDGIRVYVTPPGSRRHAGNPRRRQSDYSVSERGSASDLEAPEASPPTFAKQSTQRLNEHCELAHPKLRRILGDGEVATKTR
ncbi:hypothetical protein ABVK25_011169 [Lepraria finkii]|uniref:Uncharacterized protein n=1 Tax=Lepraria finkii TaxID=1340010 RepID=A0ABR4AQK0_9LECA